MAVLQDININVHGQPSEKRLQTFLRLSQNENGRMINFRVLGPPLPSGCTATFSGTKPDGNVYSKTGTVAGNFVIIQEDMQMTAVAGVWDAKLDIINGSHNIMTALIRVVIDADVVDPDAIASDSQLQGLVAEAKYYAEHARTDAYGSPLTAALKTEMTDKTRVYVYTGSETGMTAGNWYYWNGSAWTSGGVYNAVAVQTDKTLTVQDKAADGKATGDALNALKEDLNHVISKQLTFEQGTINTSTGKTASSSTKVRTSTYYPISNINGIHISVPSGYKINLYAYSTNTQTAFISCTGYLTGEVTSNALPDGCNYLRFTLGNVEDTNITPENAPDIYVVNYTPPIDQSLSVKNGCADAWVTGNTFKSFRDSTGIFGNYNSGYYSSSSNTNFPNPIKSSNPVRSELVECVENEVFYICGNSNANTSYIDFIFFDSTGTEVWHSGSNEVYHKTVIAPTGSSYLGVNTDWTSEAYVVKLDELNCKKFIKKAISIESGGFKDSTGNKITNTKRIRTAQLVAVYRDNVEVVMPKGYLCVLYMYDELGNYLGIYGSWKDRIVLADIPTEAAYINILIKADTTPSTDISDKTVEVTNGIYVRDALSIDVPKSTDVQEIEEQLNYLPNVVLDNKTIDENGDEVSDSSFKTTDFVKIPLKYTKSLLYTHAFSESGYSPIVAFYDGSMEFIERISSETCVQNSDAYVYVKAVFPKADSKCSISFSNESLLPDYAPPKKYLLYKNDLNSYDKNVISDGTVTNIINTGLMYIGDEQFGYGTEHTAFGEECIKTTRDTHTASSAYEGERYQMDCSTFVLLMMMGIVPECSRYFYSKNIPSQWGYRFNRLVEYEGYVYGVPQTGNTKRLYANSIAEYAYKNGYLFLVNADMSNLRAGDIFFLSNQGSSYGFFENIGHCGMVIDTIPMEDGSQSIVTFESNGGNTAPCRVHTYSTKNNAMIYAARFPMPHVSDKAKQIAEFSTTVTTALSGNSGDVIDIASVQLSDALTDGRVYTVNAKCKLPSNCHLQIKANGMTHLGVSNANVVNRPDGRVILRIFGKAGDTIANADTITLQAKCTGAVSGSAVLSEFSVYDGYVS